MHQRSELLEKVETFQNMLISYATGVPHDDEEYKKLREDLLNEPTVKDILPRFVRTCRDVKQFWALMKQKSDRYQGRRLFLWEEFAPTLQALEQPGSPADKPVSDLLAQFDPEHIHQIWERALARRAADRSRPRGLSWKPCASTYWMKMVSPTRMIATYQDCTGSLPKR